MFLHFKLTPFSWIVESLDIDFNSGIRSGEDSIALATDGSGDIYVAGGFTHYNSIPVVNLIRLTVEGALVK